MQKRWMAQLVLGMSVACGAVACGKSDGPAPGGSSAPQGAKGAGGTKDVALTPLPLKVKLPASEPAQLMDKTRDGRKSVGVGYEEVQSGLNVSEPTEKTFDEVKKRVAADPIYPFKRWVTEGPNSAVEEFSYNGKAGFVAWSWREVAGKPYLCQSTGMSGLKSAELAQKVLKVCETLAAK